MDKIYDLISKPVFDETRSVSLLFESALREEIENQTKNSQAFSKFLAEHEWKNGDPLESLPYLPVGAFKHQSLLTQVTGEARGIKLSSSGTSGLASSIFIDQETSRRQKLSVRLTLEDFFGSDRVPALVFDSDPKGSDSVGARQAAIMGYIRNASEVQYLIEEKNGLFTPSSSWNELLKNPPSAPVYVVGFTFVLWRFLSDQLGSVGVRLPRGSKVIHIGGWKKLESEKISNKDFSDLVSNYLGVEPEEIHDIYGFTELMGVSFIECSFGNKHVPKWVRASSLNLLTLEKQESHQQGLLAFQSPLAHSYLGLSIVTDDMGFVDEGQVRCLCGRPGQTIRVTGRRSKAEIRGCGDILGSTKFEQKSGELKTNFISGLFPVQSEFTLEEFQVEVTRVRSAAEGLKSFNLGEKLEVIEALREQWKKIADADKSGNLRKNGVSFLVEWSSPDRLRKLLDSFLPGGRVTLDRWATWNESSGSRIRSVPRGLMTQWVSGNVPALGIFPIIYSWITNNSNVSRLSTRAFELTLELLHPLKALAPSSDAARALSEATLAVTFDHSNNHANQIMSRAADTIIAWGGESAIESISSLPAKRDVKPLFFGPRTSYAVVFESAIDSDSRLGVIARRLVADSTVFEQAACASPHTVLVVTRDPKTSEKLAHAIAAQFEREGNLASAEPIDDELLPEITLYRKRRLLDSKVLAVSGYATVVMPASTSSLPEPVFGRTLHVVRIESLEDARKFTSPYLQSVSIAGNPKETETLAEMLVSTGVKRFPTVGKITNFENPWDGEDIISALVRTSTLGGP